MKTKFLLLIALSLLLSACSWLNNKTSQNPPTDTNMICANIEREMLAVQSSQARNNTTRHEQLYKEYRRYNCDKIK